MKNKKVHINIKYLMYLFFCLIFFDLIAFSFFSQPTESESNILGAFDFNQNSSINIYSRNNLYLKYPEVSDVYEAQSRYEEKLRRIEEERKRIEEEKKQFEIKVLALNNYLIKKNSPMAPYSRHILETCLNKGSHYCKYYLSIAGVESGFGRIPIGCCNAHGLVGLKFETWEVGITKASNIIYNNYYSKGVDTFEELAYSPYGPVNEEKWIKNLYSYYNQMTFL